MYLSCLLIDVGDNPDRPRPGRLWLRNLYHVHQRLCMGFPSAECKEHDPSFLQPYDPGRFPEDRYLADRKKTEVSDDILKQVHAQRNNQSGFLFRIDPLPASRAVIVIQSAIEPDWDYAFQNAGYLLACKPDVKQFDTNFQSGQSLHFRLVANPTRRLREKSLERDGKPVKKESIGNRVPVRPEKLEEWLTRRAAESGFRVQQFLSIQAGYLYFKKDEGEGNRLRSVRYDGVLKVTGPEQFRDALAHGIGPGKAFGFGLLSVAPLRSESWEV